MRRLALLLFTTQVACLGVNGSGISATETREPGAFQAVGNELSILAEVTLGDSQSVTITCDDNLLQYIRTEVHGGELQIDTPNNTFLRPNVDCFVSITTPTLESLSGSGSGDTVATGDFPDLSALDNSGSGAVSARGGHFPLQSVHVSGSGALNADDIDTNCVTLDSTGSGTLHASGVAGCASLDSSGSGGIDAISLTVLEADIHSSGSGDVSLTALKTATIDLSGSGNVRVAGGASMQVDDSGSGEVLTQ